MGQAQRARKADDPGLRAAVEKRRRAGLPLDRRALAAQYGVSVGTVQAVRSQVDAALAAGPGVVPEFTGGRLVRDFNGRKLYYIRRYVQYRMQEQLADDAKVSRGEVGHLERLLRRPTLRTLVALAGALSSPDRKVKPGDLTGKFSIQPPELIAEGETIIYDPLHPVPLAELMSDGTRGQVRDDEGRWA